MAYTTINKSTDYFNTKLWSGNNGTQAITGVGFQPDWLWIKARTGASNNHRLVDAVRGVTKVIYSSSNSAEGTASGVPQSFDSDGFTLNTSDSAINGNGVNYVGWNWKAGGGQGSSNTSGSINTTYTSVNTTAGFSISKFTGTGANATVGHGLGVVPKMIIVKNLSDSDNWVVYHNSLGNTHGLYLNTTDNKVDTDTFWNDTTPTTTVFSVGTHNRVNGSGDNMIAYCFADKTGYSKFGSYTGNGNADGTFVYTGFKPAFVIVKATDTNDNWTMYDNKRIGYNPKNYFLYPNLSNAEDTSNAQWFDMFSNGFKIRATSSTINTSGNKYIYWAFGQSIVGSNNVPATAR